VTGTIIAIQITIIVLLFSYEVQLYSIIDPMIITPYGGDNFTLRWGSDGKLNSLVLCHPQDHLDATYFLGTTENSITSTTTTSSTTIPTTTTLPTTTLPSTTAPTTTTQATITSTTSTTTTSVLQCNLPGDYPPCNEVTLSEVINAINKWVTGELKLSEIVTLINAWATG
jgi:hypothetical protein